MYNTAILSILIIQYHGDSDPEPSVGLRGAGYVAGVRTNLPATALPAPVALSATFDPGLARLYGQVMGLEGRARNQDVLLAPMVNLIRVLQTVGSHAENKLHRISMNIGLMHDQ